MSDLQFRRAAKEQAKLRAAVFGPSGAGKTYSMLRIATGLGESIAVIDTERGSASKYADRFVFDSLDLPQRDIGTYCEAIQAAGDGGYGVLIIDSLSHAWQELLAEMDRLAATEFRGNSWGAWSKGTPKQRMLVDALLAYPGHVLASMRSKTEWAQETDDRGKIKPVRIGLAPEQGKGIEYEFDLLIEINQDHYARILKDRSGRFQDRIIETPGEDFGRELAAWLSDGALAAPSSARPTQPEANPVAVVRDELRRAMASGKLKEGEVRQNLATFDGAEKLDELTEPSLAQFRAWVRARVAHEEPAPVSPAPSSSKPPDILADLERLAADLGSARGPAAVDACYRTAGIARSVDLTTLAAAPLRALRRALSKALDAVGEGAA